MSLIPSAVQGAPGDNYFPAADFGILRQPRIYPLEGGTEINTAELRISDNLAGTPNSLGMVIYVVGDTSVGGLIPGFVQTYMYGPSMGESGNAILSNAFGLGNGYCAMSSNRAAPVDPARLGTITGTGAPQTINVPSITENSDIYFTFVAGTPAVAAPIPTIVADTSFTVSLPAGAVYNYEVIESVVL